MLTFSPKGWNVKARHGSAGWPREQRESVPQGRHKTREVELIEARRKIERSLIEMKTFEGRATGQQYLIVKGHVNQASVYQAFTAHVNQASVYQAFTAVELKEAVLHIRGKDDTPEERKKINSKSEARKIWKNGSN